MYGPATTLAHEFKAVYAMFDSFDVIYFVVLRQRISIARVLESETFDPDIAEPAIQWREDLLAGGGFDQMFGRGAAGETYVHRLAVVVGPEPLILRTSDLLHDRTAASPWGQTVRGLQRARGRRSEQL